MTIISLEQLKNKNACEEAIKWFEGLNLPDNQTPDLEITPAAFGLALADPIVRQWIGWAFAEGIIPIWSMKGANLRWADLRWADLRKANLWGADLRWADLRGAKYNRQTQFPYDFDMGRLETK